LLTVMKGLYERGGNLRITQIAWTLLHTVELAIMYYKSFPASESGRRRARGGCGRVPASRQVTKTTASSGT
jgi:hypothetical protein